ncbi:MAG: hypothetical protein U5Q44_15380 [Dehalococcoidia bacterium]|nr:hypothetical protein [Dehalococcoidia bacterium]
MISSPDGYGPLAQQRYELVHASLREVGWDVEERYMEYGRYITSAYNGDMEEGVGLGYTIGTVRDPHDYDLSRSFSSSSSRRNWAGRTAIDEPGPD